MACGKVPKGPMMWDDRNSHIRTIGTGEFNARLHVEWRRCACWRRAAPRALPEYRGCFPPLKLEPMQRTARRRNHHGAPKSSKRDVTAENGDFARSCRPTALHEIPLNGVSQPSDPAPKTRVAAEIAERRLAGPVKSLAFSPQVAPRPAPQVTTCEKPLRRRRFARPQVASLSCPTTRV